MVHRYWRAMIGTLALAMVLTACGSSSATRGSASCTSGALTIHGVQAHQYCGPAHALASIIEEHWDFTGGQCAQTGTTFTVNIGRSIVGTSDAATVLRQQYDYFNLTVTASQDGTYMGSVELVHHGGDFVLSSTQITLTSGMKQGAYNGKSANGTLASGSWSC